jgi:hypothetical protein
MEPISCQGRVSQRFRVGALAIWLAETPDGVRKIVCRVVE